MIGNVNNIVESLYAADNVRAQQNVSNGKAGNFSDYLDLALSNYRTGLLTGGIGSNYYLNALPGSVWQTVILEALREGLRKNQKPESSYSSGQENEADAPQPQKKKQPDWAAIRVVRHYNNPTASEASGKIGILV